MREFAAELDASGQMPRTGVSGLRCSKAPDTKFGIVWESKCFVSKSLHRRTSVVFRVPEALILRHIGSSVARGCQRVQARLNLVRHLMITGTGGCSAGTKESEDTRAY